MAGYTQEEYKLARNVNIVDFLRENGYELRREGSSDYAVIIRDSAGEHDSLKISDDGAKWFWYAHDAGGKSQIELLKRLENLNTIEAIKKLSEFSKGISSDSDSVQRDNIKPEIKKKEFVLPEKWTNNKRAHTYLTEIRGIDPEIVDVCFEKGLIYESKQFHNVVFVGQKDDDGEVKHASLRGTYTTAKKLFKGDVFGSDKKYSFAIDGNGKSIYVYESAIDALSDASMKKAEGKDWRQPHRVTLGGMSDKSLELYLERHPEIVEIIFRLDNDIDGKDKDGNPRNHGQIRAATLMEKYGALGYTVNNIMPALKDINTDLLQKVKGKTNLEQSQPALKSEIKEEASEATDIMQKLELGVKSVFTSQDYLTYLKVISKFHRYSVNNCILIKMQMPAATMVAGENAWKRDFERHLKKGEHGITVLAPQEYKYFVNQKEIDSETKKEVEKKVERKGIKFKQVNVFDVSQTEGKEIPFLAKELSFTVEQAKFFIDAITNIAAEKNVVLEFEKLNDRKKGYATDGKIVINAGMSDGQTIKTAIHELAHSRMHNMANEKTNDRRTKEVQAESVAFVVSDYFKIDTSEYSFPYIAAWSSGKDVNELKNSLNIIKKEAASIITDIEKEFNRLKEKELSLSENIKTVAVKNKAVAAELFKKGIPLFTFNNGKLASINTRNEFNNCKDNILIATGELEKNKDSIPDIYNSYLVSLFRKSYEINPIETLNIFNIQYEKSELNKILLAEDPLIKEGLNNAKNLDEVKRVISERIKKIMSIPNKVKVQILNSEIDVFNKGDLFDLKTANDKIRSFNFDKNNDVAKSITFGLYVREQGKWKYGISRFNVNDIFAEDLIGFIKTTMDKNIFAICENE